MRIDKLMIPFVSWTFWLFDVLVGDLIIGHYLSWTSIFNLFFYRDETKVASIWTVLFLPKNPWGRWARWLWAAMILVGFMNSLSVSFFFNVDGMRRSSFPPTPREKVKTAHRHQRIPQLYSFPSAYMGRNRFIGSRNHLLFLHDDVVCGGNWFRQ